MNPILGHFGASIKNKILTRQAAFVKPIAAIARRGYITFGRFKIAIQLMDGAVVIIWTNSHPPSPRGLKISTISAGDESWRTWTMSYSQICICSSSADKLTVPIRTYRTG